MKKTIYPAIIGLAVVIAITLGGWIYYRNLVNKIALDDIEKNTTYEYHYVLIADNTDSILWKSVYESAKKEAAENDAYLEYVGGNLFSEYTIEDYLEISIASKVDGIILKPDGSQNVEQLINKASANGIPVITIMEDAANSKRKSFVGVNSFQLGQQYGEAICERINGSTKKVLVLLNGDLEDSSKNLIFSQMKTVIKENSAYGEQVSVDSFRMNSRSSFDSEEAIRDIFLNSDTIPDILVCMDDVDTESAYQAVIDYNKVGQVDIIGYYPSTKILRAISKGIIPAAFKLDTEQMGQYSVDALQEFKGMGYVSEYFSVDLNLITQDNVENYLK